MFKEEASVRIATQDAVDVLMKKAFSWSSFNSNAFLTRSSSTWVLCSRVKTRSRPLPTCTALWWRWVTWCSRTLSPRPWPRCCCLHDQAQRHSGILLLCLPQSTADAAQGLDAKLASPHPSPGPVTWEGTQRRTLASSREGHWRVHHVSWVSVSVWHTCRRVPLVGVWVFHVSLLH